MFETSADFGPKITNFRTILDLNNFRTNDLMIKQVCVNQNHLVWNQRDASVKYIFYLNKFINGSGAWRYRSIWALYETIVKTTLAYC